WLHKLYSYACHPDITLFFNTPLQVALGRILGGRPQLKYHEAGMDMGFASDPYESFRIFQGKIYDEYLSMKERFSFVEIDGSATIELQQEQVRELIASKLDLPHFRRKTHS
ncbi:MAG TPA: thymidylate kinase, partial [Geobacteraceae bacterium]|nr:thymidylate kinase [Geobacteraceae bacterium]